jgi:hypothetical protein
MGSRTGGGFGYCAGYAMPGFANPDNPGGGGRGFGGRGCGRGFGGRGGGSGRGRWAYGYPPALTPNARYPVYEPYYSEPIRPTAEQEKSYLEQLSRSLEEQLGEIKERLKELASKKPKE